MSKRMILLIISALVGLALVFYGIYLLNYRHPSDYNEGRVTIREARFNVDLADNMAKRSQGLSARDPMAPNEAMLFLFPTSSVQSFWMKDMKFPLDMIWISGDTIIGITPNVPVPESGAYMPPSYYSPGAVDKVLEVRAGIADQYGLAAGDKVKIELPEERQPE